MTDQEIIDKAVADIKAWQESEAKEEQKRLETSERRRAIIQEVQRQTGIELFDAARYVSYVMQEPEPKPVPTDGERIG